MEILSHQNGRWGLLDWNTVVSNSFMILNVSYPLLTKEDWNMKNKTMFKEASRQSTVFGFLYGKKYALSNLTLRCQVIGWIEVMYINNTYILTLFKKRLSNRSFWLLDTEKKQAHGNFSSSFKFVVLIKKLNSRHHFIEINIVASLFFHFFSLFINTLVI